MSTSVSRSSAEKKISSWVRPGVLEVRANPLRLVSALIRLDLPTLERPAKANSKPFIAGSEAGVAAAAAKRHSPANSLRPAPISLVVKAGGGVPGSISGRAAHAGVTFFFEETFDAAPYILEIIQQFDLGAVATHDDGLLGHRQRVVPRPINYEARGERRQHEGEDHRHPIEDHLLRRIGRRRIELHLEP